MKKSLQIFMAFTALVLITGCVTGPLPPVVFNPNEVNELDLVTVSIDRFVHVMKINGKEVNWVERDGRLEVKTLKIEAGVHTFQVKYWDHQRLTPNPYTMIAKLDKEKQYKITGIINKDKIDFDIIDSVSKESANINFDLLAGTDKNVISSYIKYILNPTMDSERKTVVLDNEEYTLTFYPDMIFKLKSHKESSELTGRNGFVTDFTMKSGTVYLYEVDPKTMDREKFLKDSNYQDNSKFVLTPIGCTQDKVIYKIIHPITLKDKELVFSIKVID